LLRFLLREKLVSEEEGERDDDMDRIVGFIVDYVK